MELLALVGSQRVGVEKIHKQPQPPLVGNIQITSILVGLARRSLGGDNLINADISTAKKCLIRFFDYLVVSLKGQLKTRSYWNIGSSRIPIGERCLPVTESDKPVCPIWINMLHQCLLMSFGVKHRLELLPQTTSYHLIGHFYNVPHDFKKITVTLPMLQYDLILDLIQELVDHIS